MNVHVKALINSKIKEMIEEIVEHENYDNAWWPNGLEDTIVDSIELILDQNTKTQNWLSEQGYLTD